MVTAFLHCSNGFDCIDCLRSLALATMKVLHGEADRQKPDWEARLVDLLADREHGALRLLLDVSLPAMALAGHDDLADAVVQVLYGSRGEA